MFDANIIRRICQIAIEAGDAIAAVHQTIADLGIQTKVDGSEVTAADLLSHDMIYAGLNALPIQSYPIISEESVLAETANLSDFAHAWLVDPLDGTKGFIAGHPNFTVNIAFIEKGYPIFGVIEHPLTRECIWAAKGVGVFVVNDDFPLSESQECHPGSKAQECLPGSEAQKCHPGSEAIRDLPGCPLPKQKHTPPPWRVLTGHYQNIPLWKERLAPAGPSIMQPQNSSYKFCTLAKGEADIYPRGSQISAWDTAAGQCILEEAGGAVIDFNGDRLCYTGRAKSHKKHPRSGFIAISDANQLPMWKTLLIKEGVINDKSR